MSLKLAAIRPMQSRFAPTIDDSTNDGNGMISLTKKTSQAIVMLAIVATLITTTPVLAQVAPNGKMSEIERTIAVQRATQVAIWAVPAVATYGIVRGTTEVGGKLNDVVALSQPMTSRHGFLTANDVTPYAIGSLTTADGPIVVEVPPASEKTVFFGTFIDAWMRPVADAGPTGKDEGKGAKYLFLPGGYEGETPAEGYFVFPLEGHGINFALRPISQNGSTIEEAAAYARTLKVYQLAQADDPPATTFLDAFPKDWDTLPYYDIRLFEDIHGIVQSEPARERDKSMFGLLSAIGIEKGKPFEPTKEWKSI